MSCSRSTLLTDQPGALDCGLPIIAESGPKSKSLSSFHAVNGLWMWLLTVCVGHCPEGSGRFFEPAQLEVLSDVAQIKHSAIHDDIDVIEQRLDSQDRAACVKGCVGALRGPAPGAQGLTQDRLDC